MLSTHKNVTVHLLKTIAFVSLSFLVQKYFVRTAYISRAHYMLHVSHAHDIISSRAHDLLSRAFIMHRCFLVNVMLQCQDSSLKGTCATQMVFLPKKTV